MNVTYICFAANHYVRFQEHSIRAAAKLGFDIHSYNINWLKNHPRHSEFSNTLAVERGVGLWCWKPLAILDSLCRLPEGARFVYADSDYLPTTPLKELIHEASALDLCLFRNSLRPIVAWTKLDLLSALPDVGFRCLEEDQVEAGIILGRNTAWTRQFVEEWLSYFRDVHLIDDSPSFGGVEDPRFIEHRHDQSVLSLLAYRYNLPLMRDPTWQGNHRKHKHLRQLGERLRAPYSVEYDEGNYATAFEQQEDVELLPNSVLYSFVYPARFIIRNLRSVKNRMMR